MSRKNMNCKSVECVAQSILKDLQRLKQNSIEKYGFKKFVPYAVVVGSSFVLFLIAEDLGSKGTEYLPYAAFIISTLSFIITVLYNTLDYFKVDKISTYLHKVDTLDNINELVAKLLYDKEHSKLKKFTVTIRSADIVVLNNETYLKIIYY